ncbi:hypothetical protein Q8A64_14400 [Oxalobacteraceae bacterium R-40]|uniref:Uncharacterized protein n=1 Tax=Keguizhuia sedimenti TaxID=3064264 RepID=A0ABU1BRE7_9BURK|nr:hypothetical protein [Oxalobacteraceae bacterium R-40]
MPANATLPNEQRPFVFGALAAGILLLIYFGALTLVSGWSFAVAQFVQFWYYILLLAVGFGIQVGLFVRLRQIIGQAGQSGAVMATSGTASTAAMVSCCAHYLATVAPVLGATGLVTFATQFQVELFWVGLLFNFAGIVYIGDKVLKASREHAQCQA